MAKRLDRSWIDKLHPMEQTELQHQALEGPSTDGLPIAIAYSDRGPGDFVVSGPLGAFTGRGRHFNDLPSALAWAEAKYGSGVSLVHTREDLPRWAILVKKS